ncbi:BFD-like [2Fe-2S]-binding domain-containing protein [Arcobacter venerupis]|uniref:BFD-like [2Fe-2S]-binding domain-containing protein n=1 Tax=Arcobacter venerupis TaxID=1054033 RepID=A0AAE7BBD6_9BACT|nr:(2Fe-2S)-binding protein [Arcobacter venerupis]QKF67115.1 BFD-like [2Fe-2S]-binding domain-containing protein [Arcobacter venerupis]RWS49941.1 (2Fe-2S)-binding protein [Arcobacter venerupis]
MLNFEENYEVCNCKKVTIRDITNAIINQKASTLREIQDFTSAGTECRHCILSEGDFGKMKKKNYCKDILNEVKKGLENG